MIEPDMPRRVQSGMRLRPGRMLAITALLGATALSAATVVRAAGGAAIGTAGGTADGAAIGAASAPEPSDPWQPFNRKNYAIQESLEHAVIRPTVKVYRTLTPGPIGAGIHNMLVNLSEPAVLVNDVLQLRIKRAAVPVVRMVLNTTLGVLGLFDVAARIGMPHHDNEFGVTLGRYGVKSGPYLYVPLVGPSSPRDLFGRVVDFVANPLHSLKYPYRTEVVATQFLVGGLDLQISTEAQLNALLSGAVDPYATLRSAYIQHKQGEVDGSGVPLNLPNFDDTDTPPPPPTLEPARPPDPAPPTDPTPPPKPTPPPDSAPPPGSAPPSDSAPPPRLAPQSDPAPPTGPTPPPDPTAATAIGAAPVAEPRQQLQGLRSLSTIHS